MSKIPFSSDEDSVEKTSNIKQVSSVKSMFDSTKDKKPSSVDFAKKAQEVHANLSSYKARAFELASKFKKMLDDKTIFQNKNIFNLELEKELLQKMIDLAIEINNDENEKFSMGSIGWITLLLKSVLWQRDRINKLEYELQLIQKEISKINIGKVKSND